MSHIVSIVRETREGMEDLASGISSIRTMEGNMLKKDTELIALQFDFIFYSIEFIPNIKSVPSEKITIKGIGVLD